MARKPKQEEGGGGAPEWMSTYGDLVTLLLTFFILLFAMSSVDAAKFSQLAASFGSSSTISIMEGGGGSNMIMEMMGNGLIQYPVPPSSILPDEVSTDQTGKAGEADEETLEAIRANRAKEELSAIAEDLRTYFAENNVGENGETAENGQAAAAAGIEIKQEGYFVSISMQGGVTFESGTHVLRPEALTILASIAELLKNYPNNEIQIEGHTDDRPINTATYPNNLVLSSRRANEVELYLIESGLNPSILRSVGMGEWHPVADNATEEGRLLNRRVEIKIYSQVYTSQLEG